MKKRYLALLSALMMLACGTSCSSEDSSAGSSETVSSAAETSASTAATTAAPVTTTTEEVTEPPAPELPPMDSAYKVLDCLDVDGAPASFYSCGNYVAVMCYTVDEDNMTVVKCYVVDMLNDKIVRTIDKMEDEEFVLGIDAEGTVVTQYLMNDIKALYYYKTDGSRVDAAYPEGVGVMRVDPSGQLYDLGKDISRINADGSREVIFSGDGTNEIDYYDPSRERAVTVYSTESFAVSKKMILIDTSDGKTISELEIPADANVYGAGDYLIASWIPDPDEDRHVYSVFEKETGKLAGTYYKNNVTADYSIFDNCSYGIAGEIPEGSEDFVFSFLRISDCSIGTLPVDIPDAVWSVSAEIASSDRLISAVVFGNPELGETRIKLVMSDPAQINYDSALEKCDPYKFPDEKPTECGERLKDLRAEADKIEDTYGVKILLGDEVLDIDGTHFDYRFISVESDEAPEYAIDDTEFALYSVENMFARYPEGFFEQFKKNGKGGLCVALVYSLDNIDEEKVFSSGGVTYTCGLWEVIVMRSDNIEPYSAATIHHEMLHAVEYLINEKCGEINESEWAALDPEDFSYEMDFDGFAEGNVDDQYIYGLDDDPYFYRDYGKVTPNEDRATLIEGLFIDAYAESDYDYTYIEDVLEKYPHLRAKYEYLADWSSQLFGYVYWEEMLDVKF